MEENLIILYPDGKTRQVTWDEMNQLRRDILFTFDINTGVMEYPMIDSEEYTLPYWEYLLIECLDEEESQELIDFHIKGAMIILLCMIGEYIDSIAGDDSIFEGVDIQKMADYCETFSPQDEIQIQLKNLLNKGLELSLSKLRGEHCKGDIFDHPDIQHYYDALPWVDENVIKPYYKDRLES